MTPLKILKEKFGYNSFSVRTGSHHPNPWSVSSQTKKNKLKVKE